MLGGTSGYLGTIQSNFKSTALQHELNKSFFRWWSPALPEYAYCATLVLDVRICADMQGLCSG